MPRPRRLRAAGAALLVLAAAACRRGGAALPAPALAADSTRVEVLAPGLVHRAFWLGRLPDAEAADTVPGPWAVHVLDADRRQCWSPVAWRGTPDPKRQTVSALARALLAREPGVVAGVNADFFSFAPDGVPVGAHVQGGTVLAGPGDRAVFALDSAGRLHARTFSTRGLVVAGGDTLAITRWNRWSPDGLALFDAEHGRIDSLRAAVVMELASVDGRWGIARVDTAPPAAWAVSGAPLLVLGRDAPPALRARVLAFAAAHDRRARAGATLDTVGVAMAPFHPLHAVGGHGILLRGGAIPPRVDSTGNAGFARARHPRTAVGWDAQSRRLLLVTVDGRQPGYSAGMTLRELARTMRALGATEALNLDGGGSTALVVGSSDSAGTAAVRVLNRPSDRGGERAVANALMVARRCAR